MKKERLITFPAISFGTNAHWFDLSLLTAPLLSTDRTSVMILYKLVIKLIDLKSLTFDLSLEVSSPLLVLRARNLSFLPFNKFYLLIKKKKHMGPQVFLRSFINSLLLVLTLRFKSLFLYCLFCRQGLLLPQPWQPC